MRVPFFCSSVCHNQMNTYKGHALTCELFKASQNVVGIRTFGKRSYPDNIFKSSYVTPCPVNEAMYTVFCILLIVGA